MPKDNLGAHTASPRRGVTDEQRAALTALLIKLCPRRKNITRLIAFTFRERGVNFSIPRENVHESFVGSLTSQGEVNLWFFETLCYRVPQSLKAIVVTAEMFGIEEYQFDRVRAHIDAMHEHSRMERITFVVTAAFVLFLAVMVVVQWLESRQRAKSLAEEICSGSGLIAAFDHLHAACAKELGKGHDACKSLGIAKDEYHRKSENRRLNDDSCVVLQDVDIVTYSQTLRVAVEPEKSAVRDNPDNPAKPGAHGRQTSTQPTRDRVAPDKEKQPLTPRPPSPSPIPPCLQDSELKAQASIALQNSEKTRKYLSNVGIPISVRVVCEADGSRCRFELLNGLEESETIRTQFEKALAEVDLAGTSCNVDSLDILAKKER